MKASSGRGGPFIAPRTFLVRLLAEEIDFTFLEEKL